jgi:phosphoglycolate phosphatase-like HAD superfamily hydrolase
LEHFKIEPHEAIYVGDSVLDELAAEAAGIPLVAYGNRHLSAVYYIETLKEIVDLLLES